MNLIRIVFGLSIGFLVGSLWGVLNAPEKGYKTRKKLNKKFKKEMKNWNF